MKWFATLFIAALVMAVGVSPVLSYTQQTLNFDQNKTLQNNTKLGGSEVTVNGPTGGPVVVASQIVNFLLLTLGLFCLALLVYAGYIWLMARGNEEEMKRAKNIVTGTIIGLFFVLTSYGVTEYIFRVAVNTTT